MSVVKHLDRAVSLGLKSSLQFSLVGDVIKDLVENSLDAGSTEVKVSLQLDNIICIQCEDNGHGIQPEELEKTGDEYCSSKRVAKLEDLKDVRTYGFRGETLNCLSQISKSLRISSNARGNGKCFTKIYNNGEQAVTITGNEDYGIESSQGTVVRITGLFYNLPVRRNYISNINRKSMIQQIKLVLFPLCATNPALSIEVVLFEPDLSREKIILSINETKVPNERLIRSFEQIFGNLGCRMIPLRTSNKDYKVDSIFGLNPIFTDSYRFIFLNKRMIADERLYKLVAAELNRLYKGQNVKSPSFAFVLNFTGPQHPSELTQTPQKDIHTLFDFQTLSYLARCLIDKVAVNFLGSLQFSKRSMDSPTVTKKKAPKHQPLEQIISPFFSSNLKLVKDDLNSVKMVGLMDQKFILVTLDTKHQGTLMLALDQHACDERIKVERLFQNYISNLQNCSVAIEHVAWELPDVVINLFSTFEVSLSTWGIKFTIQQTQITLTNLPSILTRRKMLSDSLKAGILQHLNELETGRKTAKPFIGTWFQTLPYIPEIIVNVVNSQACHSAVKFGTSLSKVECENIIQELKSCELPFQCAHGRPSMVPLTML